MAPIFAKLILLSILVLAFASSLYGENQPGPAAMQEIRGKMVAQIPFKINGRDAREYDYYQAYDLLRQIGKPISLTIEKSKEPLEKTLILRRLL